MRTFARVTTATPTTLATKQGIAQADQRPATVMQRQQLAAIAASPQQVAQRQQLAQLMSRPLKANELAKVPLVHTATAPVQRARKKSLRARLREKLAQKEPGSLSPREERFAPAIAKKMARQQNPKMQAELITEIGRRNVQSQNPKMQAELTAEIKRRNTRRQAQADKYANEKGDKSRPDRPKVLTEKSILPTDPLAVPALASKKPKAEDLTAHHLLPYNNIRSAFTSTVKNQDLIGMQNILAFAGRSSTDSSEAYRALGYLKPHVSAPRLPNPKKDASRAAGARYAKTTNIGNFQKLPTASSSEEGLNTLFNSAAWASHNVFMGPEPKLRADDPNEGLDVQYNKQGNPTKASQMAADIYTKGFAGINPVDFASKVQSARNEADGVTPPLHRVGDGDKGQEQKYGAASAYGPRQGELGTRKYNPQDWTLDAKGKLLTQVNQPNLAKGTKTYEKWASKNNWQHLLSKGLINRQEAANMRAAVEEKRKQKHQRFLNRPDKAT